MCDNDLDTILSYLSSKINKIFCDREFVGCVKEDFDIILRSTDDHCVIFPKLKPIFLKVLRHQAVIFDLSVFCIGSGPNQLAVVCKKEFLKEQSDECPPEENIQETKAMDGEENLDKAHLKKTNRTNRPTQSFYVPPAQRSTPKKKIHNENKTPNKTRIKFKSKHKSDDKLIIEKQEEGVASNMVLTKTMNNDTIPEALILPHNLCSEFVNNTSQLPNNTPRECEAYVDVSQLPNSEKKEESDECLSVAQLPFITEQETSEPVGLDVIQLPKCTTDDTSVAYLNVAQLPYSREEEESEKCVNLDQSLYTTKHENELLDVEENMCRLSLIHTSDINQFPQEEQPQITNTLLNELVQNKDSKDDSTTLDNISELASAKTNELQESQVNTGLSDFAELNKNVQNNIGANSEESVKINGLYTLPDVILQHCTKNPKLPAVIENLRMQQEAAKSSTLTSTEDDKFLKYFETILMEENTYEDVKNGYINQEILAQKLLEYCNASDDNYIDKDSDSGSPENCSLSNNVGDDNLNMNLVHIIDPAIQTQNNFSDDVDTIESKQPIYISYNDISKKKGEDCDIDNENEEMQRVIKNINRKSRSLIKHNIRNVTTFRIDEDEHVPQHNANVYDNNKKSSNKSAESNCNKEENDSVSNWEDMFDETGDLQPEYIGKIVKRIGCDVKIVKASHDYSAYENTKYQDLEHVIELYDFPSTFKTQDLIQLYRGAYQDAMYVKWCDDTHALLVLSSPAQAQRALQINHEVIQARPLSQASAVAALTASSTDLKPAMKRPQTNMQTARRMITTHLGTKSSLSKEEVEQERQALRDAREQRRQERQNEKDAWEGRPRSSK